MKILTWALYIGGALLVLSLLAAILAPRDTTVTCTGDLYSTRCVAR